MWNKILWTTKNEFCGPSDWSWIEIHKHFRLQFHHEQPSQWASTRGEEEGGCDFRLKKSRIYVELRTMDLANKFMTKDFLSGFRHGLKCMENNRTVRLTCICKCTREAGHLWEYMWGRVRLESAKRKHIDWSVCLLTLKHLVSLQTRTSPWFQDELDLCTAADELMEKRRKKCCICIQPSLSGVFESSRWWVKKITDIQIGGLSCHPRTMSSYVWVIVT
jgi:hypothetical protein